MKTLINTKAKKTKKKTKKTPLSVEYNCSGAAFDTWGACLVSFAYFYMKYEYEMD